MAMSLYHFEIDIYGQFKQRARKLTQTSARRRNHTALTDFAARHKSAQPPRGTYLAPKAEDLPGIENAVMNLTAREAQIFNLPEQERQFAGIMHGKKRRGRFRDDEGEIVDRTFLQARNPRHRVDEGTPGLQRSRLHNERTHGKQAGMSRFVTMHLPFHWDIHSTIL
jgi:hypothetical protein